MKTLIERYKSLRSRGELSRTVNSKFAFVGIGSHATQNLYPVLDYMHVPLKYICCRDIRKVSLIEKKYRTEATTSLQRVLSDEEVDGVFVCTSPRSQFDIAREVISSGKSLFVEKPPCQSRAQLDELVAAGGTSVVGLQKRYAPAVRILQKRLGKCAAISYRMTYAVGAFPEGDPLLEMFIHPLDLLCYLFGEPEIAGLAEIGKSKGEITYQLLLRHGDISGIAELSTRYSWNRAYEHLSINCRQGNFELHNMESLTFSPHPSGIFGIPVEKLLDCATGDETLFSRSGFIPTIAGNKIVTAGYCGEIKTFIDIVEGKKVKNRSPLRSLLSTYGLLDKIYSRTRQQD